MSLAKSKTIPLQSHDASPWRNPSRGEYSVLYEAESAEDNELQTSVRKIPVLAKHLVHGLLILVLAGAAFIFYMAQTSNKYTYTDCGSTPEEARERGCMFEPMQRAWIPPECYFSEPGEDYDTFRDRKWYLDSRMTNEVDVGELESGEVSVAFTRHWHDEHCTYLFRKLALAVSMGKQMINSKALDIEHSNHCALAVAERLANSYNASFLEADRSLTESHLGFESCLPLRVIAGSEEAIPL